MYYYLNLKLLLVNVDFAKVFYISSAEVGYVKGWRTCLTPGTQLYGFNIST